MIKFILWGLGIVVGGWITLCILGTLFNLAFEVVYNWDKIRKETPWLTNLIVAVIVIGLGFGSIFTGAWLLR